MKRQRTREFSWPSDLPNEAKDYLVFIGSSNPPGISNATDSSGYFRDMDLDRAKSDILKGQIPVYPTHVTRDDKGKPVSPGGRILFAERANSGSLVVAGVVDDSATGKTIHTMLEKGARDLSIGYDVELETTTLADGGPYRAGKGKRVNEISVCFTGDRPGCYIHKMMRLEDFLGQDDIYTAPDYKFKSVPTHTLTSEDLNKSISSNNPGQPTTEVPVTASFVKVQYPRMEAYYSIPLEQNGGVSSPYVEDRRKEYFSKIPYVDPAKEIRDVMNQFNERHSRTAMASNVRSMALVGAQASVGGGGDPAAAMDVVPPPAPPTTTAPNPATEGVSSEMQKLLTEFTNFAEKARVEPPSAPGVPEPEIPALDLHVSFPARPEITLDDMAKKLNVDLSSASPEAVANLKTMRDTSAAYANIQYQNDRANAEAALAAFEVGWKKLVPALVRKYNSQERPQVLNRIRHLFGESLKEPAAARALGEFVTAQASLTEEQAKGQEMSASHLHSILTQSNDLKNRLQNVSAKCNTMENLYRDSESKRISLEEENQRLRRQNQPLGPSNSSIHSTSTVMSSSPVGVTASVGNFTMNEYGSAGYTGLRDWEEQVKGTVSEQFRLAAIRFYQDTAGARKPPGSRITFGDFNRSQLEAVVRANNGMSSEIFPVAGPSPFDVQVNYPVATIPTTASASSGDSARGTGFEPSIPPQGWR